MSDVMLFGVLRMPYEMAMGDELSRFQFWQRAQEAADRLEAAERTPVEQTAPASTGREAQLLQALRDADEVSRTRGDKYGLCDAIDNHGHPYQSQWLADLLAAPVAARELDVEAERREFEAECREDYENMGGEYAGPGNKGWWYWSDETAAAWDGWLKHAARSAAQGTEPTPATDPVKKIITGVREFYLGMLSRHLPPEAFDQARAEDATRVAYDGVAELFVALLESETAQGPQPEIAPVSTEQAGDAWPAEIQAAHALLEQKWDTEGDCKSCGWHAALSEHDVEDADILYALQHGGQLTLSCLSKDDDDRDTHRGMTIDVSPSLNNSPVGADKEPK